MLSFEKTIGNINLKSHGCSLGGTYGCPAHEGVATKWFADDVLGKNGGLVAEFGVCVCVPFF